MTTATVPDAIPDAQSPAPPELLGAVERLRAALRGWLVLAGLARIAGLAIALAALSLAVDRLFRLDTPQRLVCLLLGLGALGWGVWRWLVSPLRTRLLDAQLAQRIEAAHPALGEELTAALELARGGDPRRHGWSPALVAATVERACALVRGIDPRAALDRRRAGRHLALLLGALAVAGIAWAAAPGTMWLWLRRNLLLAATPWPRDTMLTVIGLHDGRLRLPRGDDLELLVSVEGVTPPMVSVAWSLAGEDGEASMVRLGDDRFRWNLPGVNAPMELRVRGGDDDTGWIPVELVPRPEVVELALRYAPPSYTGQAERALPTGDASHRLLAGGALAIAGRASLPLSAIELHRGEQRLAQATAAGDAFDLRLGADQIASGAYRLVLIGGDGLRSEHAARFALNVVGDREPTVRVKPEGIGDLVCPRAAIPLRMTVQDDYAVTGVAVAREMEAAAPAAAGDQPGEQQPAATPAPPQRFPIAGLGPWTGAHAVEHLHRFEVEPLALAVDTTLTLRVEATDNDARTGPKTGRSSPLVFRVVSEEVLRADLLRREQEQRQEFERVVKRQEGIVADTAAQRDAGDHRARRDAARELEKRQRLVQRGCEAVADQFGRLLAETVNNRLEEQSGPAHLRLQQGVIAPLRALSQGLVADALAGLGRAAAAGDEAARARAIAQAEEAERAALLAMRRILAGMVKWEGYQEAVTALQDVLKGQEQVQKATSEAQKKLIQRIFGD